MQKAIVILIVGAFCITLLAQPAGALQWDPKHPPPWLSFGPDQPGGEGGIWADVDESPGRNGDEVLLSSVGGFTTYITRFIIIYAVPALSNSNIVTEENGATYNTDTIRSRSTSSR